MLHQLKFCCPRRGFVDLHRTRRASCRQQAVHDGTSVCVVSGCTTTGRDSVLCASRNKALCKSRVFVCIFLCRRDAEFMDMRCALTAFLWGSGRRAEAEEAWEELQQASDGLGAAMYSRSGAVERVRHRWPPRATAALVAFLALSEQGQAEGYDLIMHEYTFPATAA